MRKIYLVKKNPELPVNGNNWIVMNGFEFMKFIQTPEGRERRKCFGQLDACSVDDVIIIAECGIETAKKWRSEKDSHDYLEAAKKPKAKRMKDTRLEVLRYGFKDCYKQKNYQDIVTVGDHIQESLLMEDEILLQYYDIAVSRI